MRFGSLLELYEILGRIFVLTGIILGMAVRNDVKLF